MRITISEEAVMRRSVGARSPQQNAGFAARTHKFKLAGFHAALGQQLVAMPAADSGIEECCRVHAALTSGTVYKVSVT